jgi:hypothetical protein
MLTQITTVKARLGIDEFDVKYDAILTNAIKAITVRFDKECNRTLARTVDAVEEFDADEREIRLGCYPLEAVSTFEVKTNEAEGWAEQAGVEFLVRRNCVISLAERLGDCGQLARVTYTGGYVLPGTTPGAGQTALPDDLEQAAVEQVVFLFQTRDKLGLVRHWPKGGIYEEFAQTELLISVAAVLKRYERWGV